MYISPMNARKFRSLVNDQKEPDLFEMLDVPFQFVYWYVVQHNLLCFEK